MRKELKWKKNCDSRHHPKPNTLPQNLRPVWIGTQITHHKCWKGCGTASASYLILGWCLLVCALFSQNLPALTPTKKGGRIRRIAACAHDNRIRCTRVRVAVAKGPMNRGQFIKLHSLRRTRGRGKKQDKLLRTHTHRQRDKHSAVLGCKLKQIHPLKAVENHLGCGE